MSLDSHFLTELYTLFPNDALSDDCLSHFDHTEFYLFDSERNSDPVVAQLNRPGRSQGGFFHVVNPDGKMIHILAVDGCWANKISYKAHITKFCPKGEMRRCECVVFDEQTLCFIEIKNNKTSKSTRTHRDKAYCQIENTYINLSQPMGTVGFMLSQFQLEAYIALSRGGNRISDSFTEAQDYFLEEYGIRLYSKKRKIFGEL